MTATSYYNPKSDRLNCGVKLPMDGRSFLPICSFSAYDIDYISGILQEADTSVLDAVRSGKKAPLIGFLKLVSHTSSSKLHSKSDPDWMKQVFIMTA